MILAMRFKETDQLIKDKNTSSEVETYKQEVEKENYSDFNFNKHYMKLLRGAQLSLRELQAYEKDGDVSALHDNNAEGVGQERQAKGWSIWRMLGFKKRQGDNDEDAENGENEVDYPDSDEDGDENVKTYTTKEVKKHLTLMPWKNEEEEGKKEGTDDEEAKKSWQKFKKTISRIVESNPFEYGIMIVVILSTIAAMITFSDPSLEYNLSLIFLGIFLLEMFMKMTAQGVVGRRSYFTSGWNQLDFTLVCLQIFDVAENTYHFIFAENDPNANILKGFRALRVARLLSRCA